MRYLGSPNQFQLRLGWLRVVVTTLGEQRLKRADLESELLAAIAPNTSKQAEWLTAADLTVAPQGRLSKRAARDITAMAEVYGVYRSDMQGLTDLGHVLARVAPWRVDSSPFVWQRHQRYIGLRLVIGAYGDVVLDALHHWPRGADFDVDDLSMVLDRLATEASSDEERARLSRQARRCTEARAWTYTTYPYLEPLRELGLVERSGATGYRLSDAGTRMRDSLSPQWSADDVLDRYLGHIFLASEGMRAAPIDELGQKLRHTIATLPTPLLGAACEAALAPVVLLTQSEVLESGSDGVIELTDAERFVGALATQAGGQVRLKAGTSTETANITWTSAHILDIPERWQLSDVLPTDSSDPPDSPLPHSVPPDPPDVDVVPTLNVTVSPPPPHVLLWLQLTELLLAPRTLGGVTATWSGGPYAWLRNLRQLSKLPERFLKHKREKLVHQTLSLKERGYNFNQWCLATAHAEAWLVRTKHTPCPCLDRVVQIWKTEPNVKGADLTGPLLRAQDHLPDVQAWARNTVHQYLNGAPPQAMPSLIEWQTIVGATWVLLEDAIHPGWYSRPELHAKLLLSAQRTAERETAIAFLDTLAARPGTALYRFEVELDLPPRAIEALREIPIEDRIFEARYPRSPGGEPTAAVELVPSEVNDESKMNASATVKLHASTTEQARTWGYEFTFEATTRLLFLAVLADNTTDRLQHRLSSSYLGASRLFDSRGDVVPEALEPGQTLLSDLDALGFVAARERTNLRAGLQRLPTLAQLGRHDVLDARTRLSMALHWLASADAAHLRPAERVYHAWVAVEHLVSYDQGGAHEAIARISNIIALCVTAARIARVHRQTLAALHTAACRTPNAQAILTQVELWFGPEDRDLYARRNPATACPRREIGASDAPVSLRESVSSIFSRRTKLKATADELRSAEPLVAWQIDEIDAFLAKPKAFAEELHLRRIEAASILMSVYELRNRVVHEADPLGFEEAPGLDDLYRQTRILIDPVVTVLLHSVQRDPFAPLSHPVASISTRLDEFEALKDWPASADAFVMNLCLDGFDGA